MAFVGGLAGAGIGSALAMLVFAPLTAVNNFLGSYYFGSGMILGEREMYQERWPQIKKELDRGRSFIDVLEEVMKESTQGVMNSAERTLTLVKPQWEAIVVAYLREIPDAVIAALRGDDIQKMIEALLGIAPFSDGSDPTLPPPSGETVNGEVTLTLDAINGMTREQLLFALHQTSITYSDGTIRHMKTVLAQKELDFQGEKTTTETIKNIRSELWMLEAEFLKYLLTLTKQDFIDDLGKNIIIDDTDLQRSLFISFGNYSRRTKSSSSDATLQTLRENLAAARVPLNRCLQDPTASCNEFKKTVNRFHVHIYVHQLVYV